MHEGERQKGLEKKKKGEDSWPNIRKFEIQSQANQKL